MYLVVRRVIHTTTPNAQWFIVQVVGIMLIRRFNRIAQSGSNIASAYPFPFQNP